MATIDEIGFANARDTALSANLLVRETNHRCSKDLQMIVSLLGLQSRRAAMPEIRQALASIGGLFIPPTTGTKMLELRVPLGRA